MPADPTTPHPGGHTSHPGWCAQSTCKGVPDGQRLHEQDPRQWATDGTAFLTQLVGPEDSFDPGATPTYLRLRVASLEFQDCTADVWLPLSSAQRLWDQLGAHLHTARQSVSS